MQSLPNFGGAHYFLRPLKCGIAVLERRPIYFLLGWCLWLASEYLFLGPWSYISTVDEGDVIIPRLRMFSEILLDHGFSLWAPYSVAGADALASGSTVGFEVLLFGLLPDWLAYGLYHWGVRACSAIFLFLLLRDRLNVHPWIAIIAAYILTLSNGLHPVYQTMAATICVWWITPWVMEKGRLGLAAAFAVGVAYAINTNYAFGLFYFPMLGGIIFALWPGYRSVGFILVLLAGYVSWSARTIFAGAINSASSMRMENFNIPQSIAFDDLQLWWPVILLLAICGAISPGINRWRNWLLGAVILSLTLAGPAFIVLVQLEILPKGIYARFLSGSGGMLAVAIAICVQTLVQKVPPSKLLRGMPAAIGVCLAAGFMMSLVTKKDHLWDWMHGSSFEVMQHHPDLDALRDATSNHSPFRVVSITTFRRGYRHEGGTVFANGFETADGYVNLYSARYKHFWDAVVRKVKGAKASQTALLTAPAGLTWEMCKNVPISNCVIDFEEFYDLNMLSLANARFIISPLEIKTAGLELLPSRWRSEMLNYESRKQREKWLAVMEGRYAMHTALFIYENKKALPRFYLASGFRAFDNRDALLDAMADADAESFSTTVFATKQIAEENGLLDQPFGHADHASVDIIRYGNDQIELVTQASGASILVITNNFSPFWKACIGDQPAKLFPAYHTFTGLKVKKGRQRIRLYYDPPYKFGVSPPCQ